MTDIHNYLSTALFHPSPPEGRRRPTLTDSQASPTYS